MFLIFKFLKSLPAFLKLVLVPGFLPEIPSIRPPLLFVLELVPGEALRYLALPRNIVEGECEVAKRRDEPGTNSLFFKSNLWGDGNVIHPCLFW